MKYKKDDPLYNKKRAAEWYGRTRPERLRVMREWRRTLHSSAVEILGGRCACCGESLITMLEIDHVHDDGYIERRMDRKNNFALYQRIRDGVADRTRYRVLCASCNGSRRRNFGLCEHYTSRWAHWINDEGMDPGPYRFAP